ncbi:hypothetical protein VTN77DRAFT_5449 [Rasamsonia byssochlamydoides]|uniref:uncharacterized protein n=1 Tax=Rasamsonia byssochlamydoides TaxID=89139 RepID=UPI00374498AA
MPSKNNLSHRRTHNLLLISKLLSLRDTASPLTLLLDSLEQPARPLIREYIRRARISKVHVTFVSFETLKRPDGVDAFILARRKRSSDVVKEVTSAYSVPESGGAPRRRLIIIDSINSLLDRRGPDGPVHLPLYLSSFLAPANPTSTPVQTSLVVTYHQDIPSLSNQRPYTPLNLSLLTYLATTIFTLHSLSHVLAQKAARDRSLAEPVFGLEEEQEGVILGRLDRMKGQESAEGIVIEMEHRRKSGRGVVEWYVLPPASHYHPNEAKEVVTLLDDHPLYRRPEEQDEDVAEEEPGSTFELKLTERQRREREGVVLPYFDAQHGDGPGEGGRILYDMGEEDDFDEEEDEI